MGLHHINNHGRVFGGAAAREHLAIRKRDSHGDQIKMHVPDGFDDANTTVDNMAVDNNDVSIVYVTLPQTFSGAATYVTLTEPTLASFSWPTLSASPLVTATNPATTASPQQTSAAPATSVEAVSPVTSAVSSESETSAPSSTADASSSNVNNLAGSPLQTSRTGSSTMASATDASSSANANNLVGSPLQTSHSASSTMVSATSAVAATASASSLSSNTDSSQYISKSSGGLSAGATAGLVIGILAALALVGGLVFYCYRRRKNPQSADDVDEKHRSFADASARSIERGSTQNGQVVANATTNTTSTAPRLSLRPLTEFLPTLAENRKSISNALGLVGAGAVAASAEKSKSSWERVQSNGTTSPNPFDDATIMSEKDAQPGSPPTNPFDEAKRVSGGAASANGRTSPDKATSIKSRSSTGSVTAASVASATAPGANAPMQGPGPRGPNNVHRVQLDFKPSMEDELELCSGQLVRMLHEYDDGWALCVRMDRSQQGVAPRTCLSKLPVKPRQGPPPPNSITPGNTNMNRQGPPPPSAQGPGPRGPPSPPTAGPGPRPLNGPMYPRPLTPTQGNRSRAGSVATPTRDPRAGSTPLANAENAGAPAPAHTIARKPVPGQAM